MSAGYSNQPPVKRTPEEIALPYPKAPAVMDTLKYEKGALAAYHKILPFDDDHEDSSSFPAFFSGIGKLSGTTLDAAQRVTVELDVHKSCLSKEIFIRAIFEAKGDHLDEMYPNRKHWSEAAAQQTRLILSNIFEAWSFHGDRCIASLVVFTSIAMHNVYSFSALPQAVKGDKSEKCRGLMQIKSREYYEMLKDRVKPIGDNYNFSTDPESLQNFDIYTIAAEYWLFKKEFCRPQECITGDPLELYLIAVSKMAPSEKEEIDNLLKKFRECPYHALAGLAYASSKVVRNRLSIFSHVLFWTYAYNGYC